jgi:hypothetical protein
VQSTTAPPLRPMLLPSHLAPASGPPSPVPSRMSAHSPKYRDGDGSSRLSTGDTGSEEISEVSAIRAAAAADQQQQHPEITIAMAGAAAAAGAGLALQPSTVSTTSSNQGTSAVVVAPTESDKAYSRKPVVAIRLDSADSPTARRRAGRLSSGSAGGIGVAAAAGAAAAAAVDTAAEGEGGDTSKARRRGSTSAGGLGSLAGKQYC